MADVETLPAAAPANRLNVTDRLAAFARMMPDANAVVCRHPRGSAVRKPHRGTSGALYDTISFRDLEAEVGRISNGLATWGVPKGTRLALLVRPGIDFVTLVFALLRAGMVIVLVDPGLGHRNLIRSLSEAEPEGFVGIGTAQAARVLMRKRFPQARWNVTVGHRWLWRGKTLNELRAMGDTGASRNNAAKPAPPTHADDAAAVIFTSGSTGPAKGVLYTHRMFDAQAEEIQATYRIEPGRIDLACFPLFALFNATMGVTTVLPEMDFSRPASADPRKLLATANDWQVTQAFASPAVWRVLGDYCTETGRRINSLRQVFSCGASVPASVLRRTLACVGADATMHTPYGATECLPVSTIEAAAVLSETTAGTDRGLGVCVGHKFESIEWRVIRILDDPIATIEKTVEQNVGEIGELIVRGPQVSPTYATRTEANAQSKIADGDGYWHRTGDVGYFDERGRFWYCGRKSQRVETREGTLFTECVEAICNTHPAVRRSALVGVGSPGSQLPVLVVERNPGGGDDGWQREVLQLVNSGRETWGIHHILTHPSLPVDIRHNAKINRERLALWATTRLKA
jgi:acyl-CoA synthetase (AMP-forming)/AMP-acid ligase II